MVRFISALTIYDTHLYFDSPRIDHWCSVRSIHILALDLLLYRDRWVNYRNCLLHSYPKVDKAYLQGSF